MDNETQITNRLGAEKSPYLKQHQHNPVHWEVWGKRAFDRAVLENKPIFVSIGYSTCHWCHVMERESFESEEVAQILNQHFVSIKIDREELPDVDQVYMKAVQVMTGHGGWPLSVMLNHDLKPFFGGTYFPKRNFMQILEQLGTAWLNEREQVEEAAEKITSYLRSDELEQGMVLKRDVFEQFTARMKQTFDSQRGGFGAAPKFPPAQQLELLMALYYRSQDKGLLPLVETTLKGMAFGGIYDQLGGGFARYSTDDKWLVPHFEKMLYDNALLVKCYLHAFQITKNDLYRDIATETLDYILRDMTSEQGGFFTAEDADSEGEEGTFYVWKCSEIKKLLNPAQFDLFKRCYQLEESGNFEHGTNVLSLDPKQSWEERQNSDLREARAILFAERAKRPRPLRDEKILCGWNGLMIEAMALGFRVTGDTRYLKAAQGAAKFIRQELFSDGQLQRRYCDGEGRFPGLLDDYSYLISGLIALYEASFDLNWLSWGWELQKIQDLKFWDKAAGRYHFSLQELPFQTTEYFDDATPNSNAVSARNLLRWSQFRSDPELAERARLIVEGAAPGWGKYPHGCSSMLLAGDYLLGPAEELIIGAGVSSDELTKKIWGEFHPNAVIGLGADSKEFPLLDGKRALEGKPTLYRCSAGSCQVPEY